MHYRFVSEEDFSRLVEDGQMLEWAVVHGRNKYGTPRGPVEEKVAEGRPVLLEIDLAGARQVRETLPGARFVFLAPPDWDTLVHRLVGRGTEDEEERERRLATARVALAAEGEFDVTIVTDSGARAAAARAPVDSGHPRPSHCHRSTRWSKSFPTSPSTASPVPCSAIPRRAAVSGLAGVTSPVGLTHFDHGRTPPESLTGGPSPVAN